MIDKLPKSLKEMPYKKYIAILNKIPDQRPEGMDAIDWSRLINLSTLSILLDVSENEIENQRATKVEEIIKAVAYLDVQPVREKTHLKVKPMEALTYDEFTTYQRLRVDQWSNLEQILNLFLLDHTKEQIQALSAHDAIQVFFCLNMSTTNSLRRLKYSTLRKLIAKIPRLIVLRLKSKLSTRRAKSSSASAGDGLI